MSYARFPDRIDAQMSDQQARILRSLATEAYQPKQFAEDLTAKEATRRISLLRTEIEMANSF